MNSTTLKWKIFNISVESENLTYSTPFDHYDPLSCNKIKEHNYKFMHGMYLTHPNVSPRCRRCKTYIGLIMHIFWECRKLKHFWKEVHDFTLQLITLMNLLLVCFQSTYAVTACLYTVSPTEEKLWK